MKNDDRRQFKRIIIDQPVHYEVTKSRQFGDCLSCDISENGIRIRLNDFLPIGEELIIQAQVAIEKMIEFVGHIVWIKQIPYSETYQAGLVMCEPIRAYDIPFKIKEMAK